MIRHHEAMRRISEVDDFTLYAPLREEPAEKPAPIPSPEQASHWFEIGCWLAVIAVAVALAWINADQWPRMVAAMVL